MRTTVTTALAVALLFLAQGCDSTVERTEPSTAISQETALSSPDAIRGIRASMFDRMHSTGLSTDWLLGPSALADNTSFRANQERHQGLNVNAERAGVGGPAYGPAYNLINDANILISGIEEGVLEPAVASKFKAEAYFMRALAQHHLVRSFGYDPDGNGGVVSPNSGPGEGFDLGIVLRTEPTLDVQQATEKPRATVPEVYDQIISDLQAADSTFTEVPGEVRENSRFFPSEAAVQGLLARVQLYQRNWGAANTAAQNAIDLAGSAFGSGLAGSVSELDAIFDETTGGNSEAIFEIDTDPATESVGINNAISAYTSIQWLAQLPTQDLISLYDSTDARQEAWYEPCFDEATGAVVDGCTGVNDEGLELQKYISEQGVSRYADDYPHLRIAEMVLIQAEARLNTDGIGAAIGRLNDLREKRNASQLDPADYGDAEAAMDEILAERRRELVAEGHRFFDLKRLGRDIQKPLGRDALTFNDYRVLDDLPPNQLSVNEELVQNPGYR